MNVHFRKALHFIFRPEKRKSIFCRPDFSDNAIGTCTGEAGRTAWIESDWSERDDCDGRLMFDSLSSYSPGRCGSTSGPHYMYDDIRGKRLLPSVTEWGPQAYPRSKIFSPCEVIY